MDKANSVSQAEEAVKKLFSSKGKFRDELDTFNVSKASSKECINGFQPLIKVTRASCSGKISTYIELFHSL